MNKLTGVFDADTYKTALENGTANPIYSSTPIANLKGIIGAYTTVTGTKEDGKPYTGLISYTIEYNATDKLAGKLSYGTATVVLSFKDDDMTDYVTCELTGIPVIAVEMTGITVEAGSYKGEYNAYDKFDTTGMVVKAQFNDGSEKTLTDEEYSIEYPDGRECLWAGDASVTVKYTYNAENGKENSDSKSAAVTVNKIDFEGLTFEDLTVPYDGESHSITVGGTFDENKMTAVYAYGGVVADGRTAAGSYTVSVVVTFTDSELLTNYNNVSLDNVTLKITEVDYDLTAITFNNVEKEFTGKTLAEFIKANGMPEGVTAVYTFADAEGNSVLAADVINAGKYTVTATFTGDKNHNEILAKTAVLTVTPKTLQTNNLSGISSEYAYRGSDWANPAPVIKVTLGSDATATNLALDTDYTVEYSSTDNAAGTTIVITVKGKGNYDGVITKSFTIVKATLNLTWDAGSPQFDGKEHGAKLLVTGGVQAGDESAVTTEALAALINISYTANNGTTVEGTPSAMGVYTPSFTNFPPSLRIPTINTL